jgi:two-component system cell cycle sensor histidine kinase/response regulator CckA
LPKSIPEPPSTTPRAAEKSPRWILLVDDESPIRQLIEIVLTSQGYAVKLAESAATALALVNATPVPPVLMICDVVMPKTDGLALTRQLLARLPELKVIFISGYLADTAWWPADLSGIRLLAKPLDNAALILAVNEALADPGAPA